MAQTIGREKPPNIWISVAIFGSALILSLVGLRIFVTGKSIPDLSGFTRQSGRGSSSLIDVEKLFAVVDLPVDVELDSPRFGRDLKTSLPQDFPLPVPVRTAILLDRNLIGRAPEPDDLGAGALLEVPPPPPIFPEDFVALDFPTDEEDIEIESLPPDPGLIFLGVRQLAEDGPLQVILKDLRNNQIVQIGASEKYGDLVVESVSFHSALFRLPDGQTRNVTTRDGEFRHMPRTLGPAPRQTP
jgi:hypothetical protein